MSCTATRSDTLSIESPGETPSETLTTRAWSLDLSVDVDNALGDVRIEVDQRLSSPIVQVWPFGQVGANPITPSWVAATRHSSSVGDTLKVVATAPKGGPPLPISIVVRTPAAFGVVVRNVGGRVTLEGVGGPIQVTNAMGGNHSRLGVPQFSEGARVVVRTTEPIREPLLLSSGTGGILLQIPSDSECQLTATGTTGGIEVVSPDAYLHNIRHDPKFWRATLGEGPIGEASVNAELQSGGGPLRVEITRANTRRPPR